MLKKVCTLDRATFYFSVRQSRNVSASALKGINICPFLLEAIRSLTRGNECLWTSDEHSARREGVFEENRRLTDRTHISVPYTRYKESLGAGLPQAVVPSPPHPSTRYPYSRIHYGYCKSKAIISIYADFSHVLHLMHKSWVLKNSYSVFLSNLTPFYLLSSLTPFLLFCYRVSPSRLVWNSLYLKLKTFLFQLAQYLESRCESPHLTSVFFYLSLWTKISIDTLVITNMKCFINPIELFYQ